MNNRTRLGRLRKLADMLDGITDKAHFDMGHWATHDGEGQPHLNSDGSFGCGTSACALGYAAMHPAFRRAGLRLVANKGWNADEQPFIPMVDALRAENAGAKFFGIDEEEADDLFLPGRYRYEHGDRKITPKMVAKRVRKLIRQYEAQG